jgi:hypothetical protein
MDPSERDGPVCRDLWNRCRNVYLYRDDDQALHETVTWAERSRSEPPPGAYRALHTWREQSCAIDYPVWIACAYEAGFADRAVTRHAAKVFAIIDDLDEIRPA